MSDQFYEKQTPTQIWYNALLVFLSLIPLYGIYKQLILGEAFGNNPMSDTGIIIFAVLFISFLIFLRMIRLTTVIDQTEIRLNLYPIIKKKIMLKDITEYRLIKYGFVGGYGYRIWTKYGTVFNIKGNQGLFLKLKNGNKYLIGTQKQDELIRFLTQCNFTV